MVDFGAGLAGAVGSLALFGFLAFAIWMDYRKKKDERDAAHQERMKAMELGYAPLDAEIEKAKAYASAAWGRSSTPPASAATWRAASRRRRPRCRR